MFVVLPLEYSRSFTDEFSSFKNSYSCIEEWSCSFRLEGVIAILKNNLMLFFQRKFPLTPIDCSQSFVLKNVVAICIEGWF
jgi:hypothetical protein